MIPGLMDICCPYCNSVVPATSYRPGKRCTCPACNETYRVPKKAKLLRLYVAKSVAELDRDSGHSDALSDIAARAIFSGLRNRQLADELIRCGCTHAEVELAIIESAPKVAALARMSGQRLWRIGVRLFLFGALAFIPLIICDRLFPGRNFGAGIAWSGFISIITGSVYFAIGAIKARTGWNIR